MKIPFFEKREKVSHENDTLKTSETPKTSGVAEMQTLNLESEKDLTLGETIKSIYNRLEELSKITNDPKILNKAKKLIRITLAAIVLNVSNNALAEDISKSESPNILLPSESSRWDEKEYGLVKDIAAGLISVAEKSISGSGYDLDLKDENFNVTKIKSLLSDNINRAKKDPVARSGIEDYGNIALKGSVLLPAVRDNLVLKYITMLYAILKEPRAEALPRLIDLIIGLKTFGVGPQVLSWMGIRLDRVFEDTSKNLNTNGYKD